MLEGLNDKQIEAVTYKDGPLLILAGAGSGKTKVLTTRISYLINEYGVEPHNILAITFTNKAAEELKIRIKRVVNTSVLACTFHSFGVKILKENYEYLGYRKNFNIMDSDDSKTLVKKIMKDLGYDIKIFNPNVIRNRISSSKNEFILPEEFKKFIHNEIDDVVYKVYKKYQEILFKNNAVDFDDLLILPIKLFKDFPNILERYQEIFKYILIDEYQDTNYAQYLLVKMIASKYKNLCVVGDDSQSIYAFRGANYKNILNFEKDYKDTKVILLEQNYRSTKNILNAANEVIRNNEFRKDKNLWSNNKDGELIDLYKAYDEVDEAQYIIRRVKEFKSQGVSLSDIAVLYRTNAQSRVFEQELLKQNIPFRIVGSFYFYSRKEIKDLLAYLRLIYNLSDDVSLERVINTPKRGIGLKSMQTLSQKAEEQGISLFEAIDSGKELEFKKTILSLKEKQEDYTLTEFIDLVLNETGMKKSLEDEHTLEADIRLENLEEFKSVTKSYEEEVGIISLGDFLTEVSLVSDIEEYKDEKDKLSLMTVHSVKGLEFDYVFIAGLEEGIFPHKNSYGTDELEEERRLMYVAITRAKEKLVLCYAKKRMLYGMDQSSVPSRFIGEIDESLLNVLNKKKEEDVVRIKTNDKFYQDEQDYHCGDKIMHEVYGLGVVVEVSKTILTVAFKNGIGIKKLIKNHKSIKKV